MTTDAMERLRTRFFSKTTWSGDCLVWTGWRDRDGYGGTSAFGRQRKVHRLALFLASGEWPPDHLNVLHSCDNPSCVRYEHLRVGTQRENLLDMDARGRRNPAVGERSAAAKLSAEHVREIRRRIAAGGITRRALAAEFGVNASVITNIHLRKAWRHVD